VERYGWWDDAKEWDRCLEDEPSSRGLKPGELKGLSVKVVGNKLIISDAFVKSRISSFSRWAKSTVL
jgi:hypothetical protein